jgi:hypothetical protein
MILLCSSRLGTGSFQSLRKGQSGLRFIPKTTPPGDVESRDRF